MQTKLIWAGKENDSLENCFVHISEAGAEISSSITGLFERQIYRVEYLIRTNSNWVTLTVDISMQYNNQKHHLGFESDGEGNWTKSGKPANEFIGCIDIDIPLTPLTNSLPINRLSLNIGESTEIQVIYFDLLKHEIIPVRQKYTRLSERLYRYQNVPNDFEVVIRLDEQGFVVDYPGLFERKASDTCS